MAKVSWSSGMRSVVCQSSIVRVAEVMLSDMIFVSQWTGWPWLDIHWILSYIIVQLGSSRAVGVGFDLIERINPQIRY
jgi:hypothetical protein